MFLMALEPGLRLPSLHLLYAPATATGGSPQHRWAAKLEFTQFATSTSLCSPVVFAIGTTPLQG